jgi:hypothetical protein
MIIRLYAVYDAKVSQYKIGIADIEDGGAMRQFSDAVNEASPNNPWNKHPEDFSLWHVGQYNTSNCKIEPCTPVNLVNATAVLSLKPSTIQTPQVV